MNTTHKKARRAVVDRRLCVACGCCAKICPLQAIEISHGIRAEVNLSRCVGCGKCAKECPAGIITVEEVAL